MVGTKMDILIISLFILLPVAIYLFMTQTRELPFDIDDIVKELKKE